MAKCAIKLGLILVFIFLYCVPSFSEDITITTYYPSPYGSYNELEVRKRIRIKGDADGDGAITYNDSRHIVDIVAGTTRHDIYNEATPSWVMDINNSGAVNIADAAALQTQVITNRETNIGYFYGNSSLPGLVVSKGNVGIGATSPNLKLEVYQTSGNGGLPVTSGTTQTFGIFRTRVGNAVFDTGGNTNGAQWIQATDATNLAVNYNLLLNPNGGNVGIGTTTPNSRLVVKGVGNTSATSSLDVTDSADASMLYVRNDGMVGIGTTTPQAKLEVNDNIRLTPRAGDPEIVGAWSTTGVQPGTLAYSSLHQAFYYYNGTNWQAQGGGGGGCYVSYVNGCLAGFTNKGSVDTYGKCWGADSSSSHFRPPGAGCPSGWNSSSSGTAYVCCQ